MPANRKESGDPKTRAIKLLARREHSARELKRKLQARGIDEAQAADTVAELNRGGWQSDERYAEMLVRTRVGRGFGPVRIEADLRMAGLSSDQIQAALITAGTDWRERAKEVHARRFPALPRTAAERTQRYRFLRGRGFDNSQISAVLTGDFED